MLSPLPKQRAMAQINRMTEIYSNIGHRALVDMRRFNKPFVFVGDLHANIPNFERFTNHYYDSLRRKDVVVTFLGDAVHECKLDDNFNSSIVMMQNVFNLKEQNPEFFHYLAGNHDSFSPNVVRKINGQNYMPGPRMFGTLYDLYGSEYVEKFQKVLESLPMFFVANGIVAVHGGPLKPFEGKSITLETLKNLRLAESINPNYESEKTKESTENTIFVEQALWGRLNKEGTHGYTLDDVNRFLSAIGQGNSILLVGHTVPDNGDWWKQHSPNHFVITGHREDKFGVAVYENDVIKFIPVPRNTLSDNYTMCFVNNYLLKHQVEKYQKKSDEEILHKKVTDQNLVIGNTILNENISDLPKKPFDDDGTIIEHKSSSLKKHPEQKITDGDVIIGGRILKKEEE